MFLRSSGGGCVLGLVGGNGEGNEKGEKAELLSKEVCVGLAVLLLF